MRPSKGLLGGSMTDPVTIAVLNAVLSPFVSKLTDNFLNRQRNTVTVAELQEQVTRLLDTQQDLVIESMQARMVVLAFARYLARTQREIFVLRDDHRLEVISRPPSEREDLVERAIEDFTLSLETRLRQNEARRSREAAQPWPPPRSPRSRSTSSQTPPSTVGVATPEALNKFFDGFGEEIMRARLGRAEYDE